MYCMTCGSLTDPGERFCANCGTRIGSLQSKQSEQLLPKVPARSKSMASVAITATALAAVAVVIALGFYYYSHYLNRQAQVVGRWVGNTAIAPPAQPAPDSSELEINIEDATAGRLGGTLTTDSVSEPITGQISGDQITIDATFPESLLGTPAPGAGPVRLHIAGTLDGDRMTSTIAQASGGDAGFSPVSLPVLLSRTSQQPRAMLLAGDPRTAGSLSDDIISSNTQLTSDIHCRNLIVEANATLETDGHNIYCAGSVVNRGTIVTGSAEYRSYTQSFGGSGGGGGASCASAGGQNGFSTLAPGGRGFTAVSGGQSAPPLTITRALLQRWFAMGFANYLSGAAGGGNPLTGYIGIPGAFGIYIQARSIVEGTISASGTNDCSGGAGCSAGGGGGVVVMAYDQETGSITPGAVNVSGGGGNPGGCYPSGSGGNGQVITFPFTGAPPISSWPLASATASDNAVNLGRTWYENESGWTGVWTRRDDSQMFDAVWTRGSQSLTAQLWITIQGDRVTVHRPNSSNGDKCEYTGEIANGNLVSGTYGCNTQPGPYSWNATIR